MDQHSGHQWENPAALTAAGSYTAHQFIQVSIALLFCKMIGMLQSTTQQALQVHTVQYCNVQSV